MKSPELAVSISLGKCRISKCRIRREQSYRQLLAAAHIFTLAGRAVLSLLLSTAMALLAYAAIWAVWYRIPVLAPETVDLRQWQTEKPYYVSFCAALASNPHGFPGHCYVVWSDKPPEKS